jgi:Fur family ferric uptake transcriptional regulator
MRSKTAKAARAREVIGALGARATPQRVRVLAELMEEQSDVTAQGLHDRLRARGERLGLATVYRTLSLLEGEGVIHSLSHRPGELCYRWCGDEHHHHLVCSRCHRVVELGECEVDEWIDRVARGHDFVATGHELDVAGLCGECRAA